MFSETDDTHDRRAIVMYKDGSIVGHVPRELSRVFLVFLKWSVGSQEDESKGKDWKCHDSGTQIARLEVPCMY